VEEVTPDPINRGQPMEDMRIDLHLGKGGGSTNNAPTGTSIRTGTNNQIVLPLYEIYMTLRPGFKPLKAMLAEGFTLF
jgi:hypothetical protein